VIETREATTPEERAAVYRFWYSVYVEEMGRYQNAADHVNRELRGPEDGTSHIFFATDEGVVVGAHRVSWGGDGFSERQIRQYSLRPFLEQLSKEWLAIGERTMVAASYRGGSVYTDLAYVGTPLSDRLGVRLSFGVCEPHLVSYYAQFGMRPYAPRQSFSEESGYIVPIVTLMHGAEPFGDEPPPCITSIASGESAVRNGEVIGTDAYLAELHGALAPLSDTRWLFSGLSSDEIERCCVHSSLIACELGDQILRVGGTARNPFIVISGRLQARRDDAVIQEIRAGELFGESGWLGNENRQADVYVVEHGTRILALSLGTLRSLGDTDPTTALKVTMNTASVLQARLRDAGRLTG
jgi:Cyclic nucleotide-binding domain